MKVNKQEFEQAARTYREQVIGNAVKARKIAPDRADDYRRLFDADPRTVTRLLTAPVEQGGLMAGVAYDKAGQPVEGPPTEYPKEWLGPVTASGAGSVAFEDGTTAVEALSSAPPQRQDPSPVLTPPAGASPAPPRVTIGND